MAGKRSILSSLFFSKRGMNFSFIRSPYIILTIFFLITIFSACLLYRQCSTVWQSENQISFLQNKMARKKMSLQAEKKVLEQINRSQSGYFPKCLSSLSLLEMERQKGKLLSLSLDHLENNFLSFTERTSKTSSLFQEKEWDQKHPVLLNQENLHQLLQILESDSLEYPPVLITLFSLEKSSLIELQEGTYRLSMQVLTREKI